MNTGEWLFIWIPLAAFVVSFGALFALPKFFESHPAISLAIRVLQFSVGGLIGAIMFSGVAVYLSLLITWLQGGRH